MVILIVLLPSGQQFLSYGSIQFYKLRIEKYFAIEQKAIVSCFVKDVAFLLGHPVFRSISAYSENKPSQYQIIRNSEHGEPHSKAPFLHMIISFFKVWTMEGNRP